MRPRCASVAFWLLLAVLAGRAVALHAEPLALAEPLDEVFSDPLLSSASVSVLVVETRSGEVVYERDGDRSLIPASNMKLITSAAALHLLGPDFRYGTELRADGPANEQGWLVGDLYLDGDGDPTVSHVDLDRLASQLVDQGVTRVTGSIVADDTCFPGPPLGSGWSWDNETYAHCAQISGLSVDRNAVVAEVRAGPRVGAPCDLVLDPPSTYLTLDRSCVTGEPDTERPVVFRRRAENTLATTGPVPLGERVSSRVTVEDPALYTAALLQRSLARHGALVGGAPVKGATPRESAVLAEHWSPPLGEILRMMNKPSDNHAAEALLRTLPRAVGEPGTADAGVKLVREWLTDLGIDAEPLRLCDGSGLSRYNLVTARALVAVLQHVALDTGLAPPMVASLPVAGVDGTLRARMQGTAAERAVRAKTGSLRGVCALSGYVAGKHECALTFSFLLNNYTCSGSAVRKLQDRACQILADYASD